MDMPIAKSIVECIEEQVMITDYFVISYKMFERGSTGQMMSATLIFPALLVYLNALVQPHDINPP